MKTTNRAFTLVEVMIVVGIIALLAAIAIPNLLRSKITANDASARATLKTIATALENYYTTNNQYPTDPTALLGVTPPYLSNDYFAGARNGYTFTHTLASYSYTLSAVPVSVGQTGTTTITITTGGVFQ